MKRYLQGWFPLDFVSTFPFEALAGENTAAVGLLKLPRLLRLGRLFKRLDRSKNANLVRIVKLLFTLFFVAHWIACAWWAIGSSRSNYDADFGDAWLDRMPEAFVPSVEHAEVCFQSHESDRSASGSTDRTPRVKLRRPPLTPSLFIPSVIPHGRQARNATVSTFLQQYTTSLYWSLTMIMKTPNVGPDTIYEKVFAAGIVVLAAFIFAYLLGPHLLHAAPRTPALALTPPHTPMHMPMRIPMHAHHTHTDTRPRAHSRVQATSRR